MLRKSLSIITSLILLTSSSLAARADAWTPPTDFDSNSIGMNLVESFFNTGEQQSKLITVVQGDGGQFNEHLCSGVGSSEFCNGFIGGQILLPYCAKDDQFNCIEALALAAGETEFKPARFARQAEGPKVTANPTNDLTEGSTVSLWSSEVANAAAGNEYAVYAALNIGFNIDTKKFTYPALTAMVIPYSMRSGNYQAPSATEFKASDGSTHVSNAGGRAECAFTETGVCGRIQDFGADTRVSLTLRLATSVGGWFKGRVVDPTIAVTPGGTSPTGLKWQKISMSGQPASVPMFYARGPKSQATPEMIDFMGKYWAGGVNNSKSDGGGAFKVLDLFKGFTQDSAAGVSSIWSMGSIASGNNPCLADTSRVLGIVSTNAMVYAPDAPQFIGGQLQYKVGGTHFLPDHQTLSEGTYDLIIDSKAARCLYGFTAAPVSASISVVSSDGQTKVATTSFKESGNWIKLSAKGFTFSDPTVKVVFSQAPQVTKKTTITCVFLKNKKKILKLTAYAPKCPAGYKKK